MAFSAEQHPIVMICTGELCATEGKAYRGIRLALGTVHIFGSTLMRQVKCLHAKAKRSKTPSRERLLDKLYKLLILGSLMVRQTVA